MMLSRSAERLYWLARYLERTENTARILSVYMSLMFDLPMGIEFSWRNLLTVFGANAVFFRHYEEANESNIMKFLLDDEKNPASLFSCLNFARENIRTSREHLPYEAWQFVNEMYLYTQKNGSSADHRHGRVLLLKDILRGCQRFTGFLSGAMSHDNAFGFIRLGRYLERADMTTRILDSGSVLFADERSDKMRQYENTLWMNVLKSESALLMYRKHRQHRIIASDVLDYLLNDPNFPRSVYHCIRQMEVCARNLPKANGMVGHLAALAESLKEIDCKEVMPSDLHKILDDIQLRLGTAHQQITANWFLTTN